MVLFCGTTESDASESAAPSQRASKDGDLLPAHCAGGREGRPSRRRRASSEHTQKRTAAAAAAAGGDGALTPPARPLPASRVPAYMQPTRSRTAHLDPSSPPDGSDHAQAWSTQLRGALPVAFSVLIRAPRGGSALSVRRTATAPAGAPASPPAPRPATRGSRRDRSPRRVSPVAAAPLLPAAAAAAVAAGPSGAAAPPPPATADPAADGTAAPPLLTAGFSPPHALRRRAHPPAAAGSPVTEESSSLCRRASPARRASTPAADGAPRGSPLCRSPSLITPAGTDNADLGPGYCSPSRDRLAAAARDRAEARAAAVAGGDPADDWDPGELRLLRFWRGECGGDCVCGCARIGIDEMLSKRGNHAWLEQKHHYVQWLFPKQTHGVSGACAPTLTHRIAKLLSADAGCAARLIQAYDMMLDFFGLELVDPSSGEVRRGRHCIDRYRNIAAREHNYLRITRVLISIGLRGRQELQGPLVEFLIGEIAPGGPLSFDAARGSLLRYWVPATRGRAPCGDTWQRRLRRRCDAAGVAELKADEVPESRYFRGDTKAALL